MNKKKSFNYKDAGVDIDAGNIFVNRIKETVKKTIRPEVITSIGGFSALCALPKKYHEPILVSGTDGIGTKLCLAIKLNRHDTIGIDLVAMCVNDLAVHGAEPLFFLDYYATHKLDLEIATSVISSIAQGCLEAGCTLIGGETAEMPNMYHEKDYDLAGFCVGVVEKSKILNNAKVADNDILIALGSSGLHSNGYSLIRKIIESKNINLLTTKVYGNYLSDHLLIPTRIYIQNILRLIAKIDVHAIAHLTGGGFWENIPRILPAKTQAVLSESSWEWPEIFKWIQETGNVSRYEMYRTFNCGVGMVIAVNSIDAAKTINFMNDLGEQAWKIGIIKHSNSQKRILINK